MAVKTSDSVGNIAPLVEDIQTAVKEAASGMETVTDKSAKGMEGISRVQELLEEIIKSVTIASNLVQQASELSEDQVERVKTILDSVSSISASTSSIVDSMQGVVSSVESQGALLEKIRETSASLLKVAEMLVTEVQGYGRQEG